MGVIETGRLNLREITAADAGLVLEVLNDPGFIRYVGDRGVRTMEDAARYIEERMAESYRRHGFGMWLVEARDGGLPVGLCGLLKRPELNVVEVGYVFLPPFRGKGYAYEAAAASAGYAREVLGLPRLYAIVDPDNAVSIRVLEKLGMKFEGTVRLSAAESEINLMSGEL